MSDCPFCTLGSERVLLRGSTCFVIRDAFPVTKGHSLVIPLRHVSNAMELAPEEWSEIQRLIRSTTEGLMTEDPGVTGFNIGMNVGEDAGQTVGHAHVHVIPRRKGDVEKPRGGIRHLMPGKGDY